MRKILKRKKNIPEVIDECGKIVAPKVLPHPGPWDCPYERYHTYAFV